MHAPFPIAVGTEQGIAGWIDGRFAVVAEQRNRIAFGGTAEALRTRYIADGEPEEGHAADDTADRLLQRLLAFPDLARHFAATPAVPGRTVEDISRNVRGTDDLAEYRTAMIASPVACGALVLTEPTPER